MITVLTPTFNRAKLLQNLYKSLSIQECKNFKWMIVDDGSSDNTEAIVEEFKEQADFKIVYIKKKNGGKHIALNLGISNIDTELIFIVDSDDTLTPDAIKIIERYHKKYRDDNKICGYSFLRGYSDGKVNGKLFVPDELIATYIDSRINSDDTSADKAEVFKTKHLKEFPFPEYPGEKFLGEDLVWIRMALRYSMVNINKVIYIGNYLDDGLTQNRRKNNIKAPKGCTERAKEFMRPQIKFKYRAKGALQYIIYGLFSGKKLHVLISESPVKPLTILCIPAGCILYYKWKKDI